MIKIITIFAHKDPIEQAKKEGLYVINILCKEMLAGTFLKSCMVSDETIIIDSEKDLERVVKNLTKTNDIDFIYSFTDTRDGVTRAAEYSDRFLKENKFKNLSFVNKVCDKFEFRKIIPNDYNIAFGLCRDINDVKKFINDYPNSVIKPTDSQASIGVTNVNKDNLEQLEINYPVIIEEKIFGNEYSAESVTINGNTKLIGVTTKIKAGTDKENVGEFVELGHVFPTDISEYKKDLEALLSFIYDSKKDENFISHTEFFITRDNKIKVVEGHTRAGGDMIPEIVENTTGYNLYRLLFYGIKNKRLPQIEYNKKSAVYYPIFKNKKIKNIVRKNLDENISSNIKDRLFISNGYIQPVVKDSRDRTAGFLICKNSINPLQEIKKYLESIEVEYE